MKKASEGTVLTRTALGGRVLAHAQPVTLRA